MKVEITEKGVHDSDGKALKVGQKLELDGDEIPAVLVNKCRVINAEDGEDGHIDDPQEGTVPAPVTSTEGVKSTEGVEESKTKPDPKDVPKDVKKDDKKS